MRRFTFCFVVLSALALAVWFMPTSAQNPQIPTPDYPFPGYPETFSPMKTWRPGKPQLTEPSSKFLKAVKPVPNRYIVKLKDEVIPKDNSIESKRDQISEIARSHAAEHRGQVGHIYAAVLRGFSIELPNETAARAISNNPKVQWVSEVEVFKTKQDEGGGDGYNFDGDSLDPFAFESDPPWGLDAIDGTLPQPPPDGNGQSTAANAVYVYNATGAGVVAYVLDTGIFNQHQEFIDFFSSRASQLADCFTFVNCHNGQQTTYFNQQTCVSPMPNSNNNDCSGHGTHVAGIIGGKTTGVAKQVTIESVKVCGSVSFCPVDSIIAGVDLVTSDHLANSSVPAVANMSLGGPVSPPLDQAVSDSIQSGVTCVFSAGNNNTVASSQSPADVPQGLTVGGVDWTGRRTSNSNFGSSVDMYAPGVSIVSPQSGNQICLIWAGTNHEYCVAPAATSWAAPFVTGLVATYLQGRTGSNQCIFNPVQGPAPPCCGNPSACPDRVTRFINANAQLNKLSNTNVVFNDGNGGQITVTSPNRFPWNLAIPSDVDPIDNQRFFVWQQYSDFIPNDIFGAPQPEPDEGGLDWWTRQITDHCGTGLNDNNNCTHVWRILDSRAFFVATHGSWFDSNYGLTVSNSTFVSELYRKYLRREADSSGLNFWVNDLTNNYGNPANATGVFNAIDAFISCHDYRYRFGPS
jgi:hypothetical protein